MTRLFAVMLVALAVPGAARAQDAFDPAVLFAAADVDRDGTVTRTEFLNQRDATFPQLDRNRDGGLSVDELAATAKSMRARFFIRRGFGRFDRDGNRSISRVELRAGPAPAFDRADADRDGRVSADELEMARKRSGR